MKKIRLNTLWLSYTGVLVALQIVLGNLVQIAMLEKQMNLGFLPIAAAGYLFGPVSAMIVAALGDILGTLIFGTGAYFPGFTVTALIVGCLYGLMMYPRYQKWIAKTFANRYVQLAVRAVLAALLAAAVYIFLNSYWITFFVSKGYWLILLGRLPFNLVEVPIFAALITLTCIALDRLPPSLLPNALLDPAHDKANQPKR
mgnify:CR=1 FL=1